MPVDGQREITRALARLILLCGGVPAGTGRAPCERRGTWQGGPVDAEAANDPELDRRVAALVRGVVGYPRPGVRFTDVSAVWEREPAILRALVDRLCGQYRSAPPPVLLAIEARGFLLAGAMAHQLGARVILARKAARLPRAAVTQEYVSGYEGGLVLGAHDDVVSPGEPVLVVDDVLAMGWSAVGGVRLANKLGGRCVGVAVAIELGHLPGRANPVSETGASLFAAARTSDAWTEPETAAAGS